jgi:high-affinity Fe2+/Pb2+ permease
MVALAVAGLMFCYGTWMFRLGHKKQQKAQAKAAILDRLYAIEKRREQFWSDSIR